MNHLDPGNFHKYKNLFIESSLTIAMNITISRADNWQKILFRFTPNIELVDRTRGVSPYITVNNTKLIENH